jgi:hypothetical protein
MGNKRTGAAVAVGASGMSASGLESEFGLSRSRVQIPVIGLGARTSRIVTVVEW